jgi:hypothetical protein
MIKFNPTTGTTVDSRNGTLLQTCGRFGAKVLPILEAHQMRHIRGGPTGGNWAPLAANQLRSVTGGPTGNPWLKA